MKSPAELLASLPKKERADFIASLSKRQCDRLIYDWRNFMARPDQIEPKGDWEIWMVMAGRGFGKTRMGAEWVREQVERGAKRIALIGETAADTRNVMVEGQSGLLNIYPPGERPDYQSSKRQIIWANGAIAKLYNATEPDQLRGPQHEIAWCDELAKWKYARQTWDQLQFGLRIGDRPRQIVTTTPRPIELVKAIVSGQEGRVHVTAGKTADNRANLSAAFLEKIETRYGGTRLGRQELEGEILGDIPGALWRLEQIDLYRQKKAPPDLGRIVIAIDPATTCGENSDEHGIIVAALGKGVGYVLEDASLSGTPLQWARRAIALYDKYQADGIVIEVNQGGDMVAQTLRSVRGEVNVIEVRASRGKHVRAEPIAALYEQGRVHHVGAWPELESQMTLMTGAGFEGNGSPDRVDALVWALSELFPEIVQPEDLKTPRYRMRSVV